jgi:hypothetical protein
VVLVYLMLAFPDGRIWSPVDRALVLAIISLVVTLYLPTGLLAQHYPTPTEWVTCAKACPHSASMILGHEPGVIGKIVVPVRDLLTVMLFAAVVVRLSGRIARASRVRRRTLTPVLAVAAAGVIITSVGVVVRRVDAGSQVLDVVPWLMAFALPGVALCLSSRPREVAAVRRQLIEPLWVVHEVAIRAGRRPQCVRGRFRGSVMAIVYPVGRIAGLLRMAIRQNRPRLATGAA